MLDSFALLSRHVAAYVNLAREGQDWIARARSAADGDIELRLPGAVSSSPMAAVTGTLRGTAYHFLDLILSPQARRVSVTGAGTDQGAPIEGILFGAGFVGTTTGSIAFVDRAGATLTCTQGTAGLIPVR